MKDLENKTGNPCYNYNVTTKSIVLEKQIEEAAKIDAGFDPSIEIDYDERYYNGQKCEKYDSFMSGVKSKVAKQYWQQGIYTEEEVRRLLNQCNCLSKSIEDFNEQEWFEQNKKK